MEMRIYRKDRPAIFRTGVGVLSCAYEPIYQPGKAQVGAARAVELAKSKIWKIYAENGLNMAKLWHIWPKNGLKSQKSAPLASGYRNRMAREFDAISVDAC